MANASELILSYLVFPYSFLMPQGNIYIERQYIITTCFQWIILHIWQYNITSTPPQNHRNTNSTLFGIFICLSDAIQSPERYHANEYDFQWVTRHIGQFIIILKPILSHQKAHRSSSGITILLSELSWQWKDILLSLPILSGWISNQGISHIYLSCNI